MINEVKRIFDDIRDAIIEMGGNIDICTSPDDYDSAIKSLAGNNAVLFVPVFKSSDVKPDRPTTQMSSNNPTSYPDGWSTPDGLVDNIWMTYTIVGPETVYVNWTEPLLVHSTGEQGGEGLPKGMTRTFLIYAEYPSRNVTLSRPQGGHWDAENNLLTGNITSVVTPDDSETTDTVLWYPDNNHEPGLFTWLSSGTFRADTGELLGQWSEPICITAKDGENGRNGADGTEQEYIYKLLSSTSEISRLERPYSDPDVDDYVPTGWTDSPLAIDPDIYPVEVMCSRVKNKVDKKWGLFSMPIPWAVWGQDGTDGDGVEYIFLIASPDQCQQHEDGSWELTDSTVFPPLNEAQYLAQTRETGISDELALQAYQNDEFVPGDNALAQSLNWDRNWTDDPSDVSENEPLEFVSIRKYRKVPLTNESEWGWYSVPKLWNKWAYVDASIFTAFAFTRTNENLAALNPALVIEGGSDNNPIPDPSQYTKDGVTHTVTWYDSIPAGNGTVWMTQRVFGQPNSTWSSARKMADTDRFQVEYSNSSEVTVNTQLPTLNDYVTDANPEGVDETAWRTYCNNNNLGVWNDDNSVVDPLWMATCNKVNGVWSSWHIARIRGENSVRIDFTNDKDELIYDTYGNKVSNRNVSTTAMLYDGSTQVTSNVTWRFYSVSGVDIPSGQNAIASFPAPAQLGASAAYIRTDGEILVTGIKSNANEAVLVVEATYNGAQYYKQFWVGKIVGQDNYYLDFTPNVIVYNTTTGNPSTVTLNVKVMKESYVDGSISVAPAMPSGYKVFLYDGNTIDVNWTDVDKNYSLSMSNSIQDLQLLLATAKTGGTVEDGPEDILVNFVANGEKGEKGEDGSEREWVYLRSDSNPGTPPSTGNGEISPTGAANGNVAYNNELDDWVPNGWWDHPQGVSNANKTEWASYRDRNKTTGKWDGFSPAVVWSHWGEKGQDGDGVQYVFKLYPNELTSAQLSSFKPTKPASQNANGEWLPAGKASADTNTAKSWTDEPEAVNADYPYCYCSQIKCINGTWGTYETLGLWAKYGIDGATGDRGRLGPRMRMRNWDYYTNLDAEGLDEWQCGDNDSDTYYDIAIWPAVEDGITIDEAYANANSLWRCKANLKYNNPVITANSNPSTLPDYFVQAVGWDFVATKLLLSDKIKANQIDVHQLSVNELHTSNNNGETLDIMNNVINLQQDGQTRCKISGENVSTDFDNSKQIIVGTTPGNEFLGGPVIDDIGHTGNRAYFEGTYTLGTVHINAVSSGTQRDLIYSENIPQQWSVHLKGQGLQEAISGHNIECSVSLEVYAVDQSTDAIVQEWYVHEGSEALTTFTEYYDHFTLSGDPFLVDMRNNAAGIDNEAFPITGGDYTMYVKAILMLTTDSVSGLPSGIYNPEVYLNWVTFDPIINHHTVATTLVEFTEIGADGLIHGINENNYFKVVKNDLNNTLTLEFLTGDANQRYGLQISSAGIKYYNNGNWLPWTTP